jgi:hypothetical protein
MATKLTYPRLPDGYYWNLRNKIFYKIGKRAKTRTTGQATYIEFVEDLTPQEEADVNAIMASPSTACDSIEFASANNRKIVKDIWDWRDQIETACGFNVAITYRSSGLKGNANDEIVIQGTDPTYQMEKLLTNTDRRNLQNALIDLIRDE